MIDKTNLKRKGLTARLQRGTFNKRILADSRDRICHGSSRPSSLAKIVFRVKIARHPSGRDSPATTPLRKTQAKNATHVEGERAADEGGGAALEKREREGKKGRIRGSCERARTCRDWLINGDIEINFIQQRVRRDTLTKWSRPT